MDGLLLIDKPADWTSFDVVAKVRSLLKTQGVAKPKVGHAGTLDPLATGLMLILVGGYCKRAQEFSKLDKTYEVEAILGRTSTTGDEEGEKTIVSDRHPTREEIQAVLAQFTGTISQVPPAYSAVKVNGQRAYKLARAGQDVKLEPRQVTIYEITAVKYDFPNLNFTCSVSSGTYIRSLVADIGEQLGTGAYMSGLTRTRTGEFDIEQAHSIDEITKNAETLPLVIR